MDKKPRSIVLADNWKMKEIKLVLALRDEMVEYSIDNKLIQEYLDEEYERINIMYEERIKRYNDKINNVKHVNVNKKKRKEAINFIIKNKEFLQEKGYDPKFIENYANKHYSIICKRYSVTSNVTSNNITSNNIINNNISFID